MGTDKDKDKDKVHTKQKPYNNQTQYDGHTVPVNALVGWISVEHRVIIRTMATAAANYSEKQGCKSGSTNPDFSRDSDLDPDNLEPAREGWTGCFIGQISGHQISDFGSWPGPGYPVGLTVSKQ